jgi:hypothetical protein
MTHLLFFGVGFLRGKKFIGVPLTKLPPLGRKHQKWGKCVPYSSHSPGFCSLKYCS